MHKCMTNAHQFNHTALSVRHYKSKKPPQCLLIISWLTHLLPIFVHLWQTSVWSGGWTGNKLHITCVLLWKWVMGCSVSHPFNSISCTYWHQEIQTKLSEAQIRVIQFYASKHTVSIQNRCREHFSATENVMTRVRASTLGLQTV